MWRCDRPTRLVLAALAGLVAAPLGVEPAAAAAAALAVRPRPVLALVVLIAVLWSGARVAEVEHRALPSGPIEDRAVVTGRPSGGRVVARLSSAGEDVLLVSPGTPLEQGAVLQVRGELSELGEEVRGYYRTQGVHLELRAAAIERLGRRGGLWGDVDRLHRAALDALGARGSPTDSRALVAGITLGETGAMSYEQRDRFRRSGLAHLVAVSGQNVALVIGFALVTLGLAGVIGAPSRWAALGLTVAYVLVTGAGPSIVRAGVSGGLITLAWLVSRPVVRWHLVACGAAAILCLNPLDLFNPGFQLSFAAVAAILLVAPRVGGGTLRQALAISIACSLITTPISWWHFGRVAPLSVPANLLALPAVAPILALGLGSIALGSIWSPLAAAPLALADLLAAYVLWVADLFS